MAAYDETPPQARQHASASENPPEGFNLSRSTYRQSAPIGVASAGATSSPQATDAPGPMHAAPEGANRPQPTNEPTGPRRRTSAGSTTSPQAKLRPQTTLVSPEGFKPPQLATLRAVTEVLPPAGAPSSPRVKRASVPSVAAPEGTQTPGSQIGHDAQCMHAVGPDSPRAIITPPPRLGSHEGANTSRQAKGDPTSKKRAPGGVPGDQEQLGAQKPYIAGLSYRSGHAGSDAQPIAAAAVQAGQGQMARPCTVTSVVPLSGPAHFQAVM